VNFDHVTDPIPYSLNPDPGFLLEPIAKHGSNPDPDPDQDLFVTTFLKLQT
jgi:hypothetical protein